VRDVPCTIKTVAKIRNGNITLGKGACGRGEKKLIHSGDLKGPDSFQETVREEN